MFELPEEEVLPSGTPLDLGHGVLAWFSCWAPDRDINPQYDGIPDIPKCGLIYRHPAPNNPERPRGYCMGAINFDLPGVRQIFGGRPLWQVLSWEPLTLSPSLLCKGCGHHGFIREGKWVPA